MGRFIEGCDRRQQLFLPGRVNDYVARDSPVRVVDVFVDELLIATLGFADAAVTGHRDIIRRCSSSPTFTVN